MKNKTEFYERQNKKQWWIWLLLILLNGLFIGGIIWQIGLGNTFGNNPMSDGGLVAVTIIFFLFSLLLLFSRLDTIIDSTGIYIRYFPFNLKYKYFGWDIISKVYVRKYKSLREYGGFGIRFWKGEKAYIMSGNAGLQIELKNSRKVLVGTQQPREVQETLKNYSPDSYIESGF